MCVYVFFLPEIIFLSWVCAIFSKVKPQQQYVCSSSSKAPRYFLYLYLRFFFREFTSCLLFVRYNIQGFSRWLFWFQPGCRMLLLYFEEFEFSRSFLMMMRDDIVRSFVKRLWILFWIIFPALLQFELIGYFGRDFFEAYRGKGKSNKSGL